MDFLKYAEKLSSLKYYIESSSCVNANPLSLRLGVSKRTVLRMVETLRQQGVNVIYCAKQKKYLIRK